MKKATFSALTVSLGLVISGCTVVPGMHMDKTSAEAAERATTLAKAVEGVTEVQNKLVVG